MKVTRCSAIASRATSGWNRLAKTSWAPRTRATAALMTAPVMWKSGAMARTESPGSMPAQSPKVAVTARTLAWVFIAPFGGPVVPEV